MNDDGPIVHLDLGLCLIRPWREQDDFPHPFTETHATRFLARAVTADPTTNFGGIGYAFGRDDGRARHASDR